MCGLFGAGITVRTFSLVQKSFNAYYICLDTTNVSILRDTSAVTDGWFQILWIAYFALLNGYIVFRAQMVHSLLICKRKCHMQRGFLISYTASEPSLYCHFVGIWSGVSCFSSDYKSYSYRFYHKVLNVQSICSWIVIAGGSYRWSSYHSSFGLHQLY